MNINLTFAYINIMFNLYILYYLLQYPIYVYIVYGIKKCTVVSISDPIHHTREQALLWYCTHWAHSMILSLSFSLYIYRKTYRSVLYRPETRSLCLSFFLNLRLNIEIHFYFRTDKVLNDDRRVESVDAGYLLQVKDRIPGFIMRNLF